MSRNDIPKAWLWPDDLTHATQIQRELAQRVEIEDRLSEIQRIGGTDASNLPSDPEKRMTAVCVSLDYPSLQLHEVAHAQANTPLPYVPGFLGFREAPALVEAIGNLLLMPDLLLVDGHGISHPRRLGIASHLGVLLDCPSIGIAKSILVGRPKGELGPNPGDHVPLIWKGGQIGWVLRSRANVLPIYVSPGHRISMDSALVWAIRCLGKTKLPEPTRLAHNTANRIRRESATADSSKLLQCPLFSML
jgi:deoxyribonuclease V